MKHYLDPFMVCEFAKKCQESCQGKDPDRSTRFSCGLRRGLLLMEESKAKTKKQEKE